MIVHDFFPFNVIVSIGTEYFDDWHVVGWLGLDRRDIVLGYIFILF